MKFDICHHLFCKFVRVVFHYCNPVLMEMLEPILLILKGVSFQ